MTDRCCAVAYQAKTSPASAGDICLAFQNAAEQWPNRPCLTDAARSLTYREVEIETRRVALSLLAFGVAEGDIVGIHLARNVDMMLAILGILRAGAAYLPLDPTLPEKRIRFCADDCGAKWVLSDSDPAGIFADSIRQVSIAELLETRSKDDRGDLPRPRPDQLAYVIYTSGSTGQPKGVEICHEALSNHLEGIESIVGINEEDVWLATNSIAFDASVTQIFLPLIAGAELAIADEDECVDGALLANALARYRATFMDLTPSGLKLLVDQPDWRCPGLHVTTGGEVLPPDLAQELLRRVSRLWNMYGPTEATVIATYFEVTSSVGEDIPIGQPCPGYDVWIVDDDGQVLPTGEMGEICIGGVGLARGYVNREELTRDRFLPIDVPNRGRCRVYRTGDYGLFKDDGQIRFRGRKDQQIKLRGYRIEVGEIEVRLRSLSGVLDAGVVKVGDGDLAFLVAFVVGESEATWHEPQIRAALQDELPHYMLPSVYHDLAELPLNSSGKLDRQELERMATTVKVGVNVKLRDPVVRGLQEIWLKFLPHARLDGDTNILHAGAHSLLIMRALVRINRAFKIELSSRDLFEHPTLNEQARLVKSASKVTGRVDQSDTQVRKSFSGWAITSAMQRRLWVMSQFEGGSAALNLPVIFDTRGDLNIALLTQAVRILMDQNQSLRASFEITDGNLRQYVASPGELRPPIQCKDMTHLSEPEADAKAKRLIEAMVNRTIDLDSAPCFRILACRIVDDRWLIALSVHHIISDGWASVVLIERLSRTYEALARELEPSEYGETADYVDFVNAEQERLASEERRAVARAYWSRALSDPVPVTSLPMDNHDATREFVGHTIRGQLDKEAYQALEKGRQELDATVFMLLLAAVKALVYRYSRDARVMVGVPVSDRRREEFENTIGCMMSILPLVTPVPKGITFRELVASVKDVTLGAMEHQDIPLDELDESGATAGHPRMPIMPVLLAHQQFKSVEPIRLPNLTQELLPYYHSGAQSDLVFYSYERSDRVELELEYASGRFEEQTAQLVLRQLKQLLASALAEPDRPLDEIGYLLEKDSARVQGGVLEFDSRPLHMLVDQQAAITPEALAVSCEHHSFSYKEVAEYANRVAALLLAEGTKPGANIGMMLPRSALMVPICLGIMKAGAAYVPFSENWPKRRIQRVLSGLQFHLIITNESAQSLFKGQQVLCWDKPSLAQRLARHSAVSATKTTSKNIPAYVLHTSGSTGTPQAVQVGHGALSHFVQAAVSALKITSDDVVGAITTLTFDISILELFAPLTIGASVRVFLDGETAGAELRDRLDHSDCTILQATPSTWISVLQSGWNGKPGLRAFSGGEAMTERVADQLLPKVKELWNLYGPTEATVWVSAARIQSSDTIDLGSPFANTGIHIVDENLALCPLNVVGELCITGPQLANGYLNNEPLNSSRFVTLPSGARAYRTGDRAALLRSGQLRFFGRSDNQVKLRGFRIELQEIETEVNRLRGVDSSFVRHYEISPDKHALVCYILKDRSGHEVSKVQIRKRLMRVLPYYMIPQYFVELEKLPRFESGKVKLDELPSPHGIMQRIGDSEAPRTKYEKALADIWCEELGLEEISRNANFFELGGHSLSALRVINHVQGRLGKKIQIRDLLFFSLANIAKRLSA